MLLKLISSICTLYVMYRATLAVNVTVAKKKKYLTVCIACKMSDLINLLPAVY